MSKPISYRYTKHCKFCRHSRIRRALCQSMVELHCDKHNFVVERYDVTNKVCDDFKDEDVDDE